MSGNWKFRMRALSVGLGIIVLQFAVPLSDEATEPTLPKDPCALLKPADIQTLAPDAKIGSGVPTTSTAPLAVSCMYSWGPRSSEWGETDFTITIFDASKVYPGASAEMLEQGMLAKVKTSGPNASQIAGVGDAAAFTYEARSFNATAEAYLKAKGVHLVVEFHGNSLANKDKVIALLKTAVGRL